MNEPFTIHYIDGSSPYIWRAIINKYALLILLNPNKTIKIKGIT